MDFLREVSFVPAAQGRPLMHHPLDGRSGPLHPKRLVALHVGFRLPPASGERILGTPAT